MPNSQNELSATQIEQSGRLLLPMFQQAVRHELHALRNDFNSALLKQTCDLNEKLNRQTAELEQRIDAAHHEVLKLNKRVASLEAVKFRVMLAWGGIVGFVTLAYHMAKDFILKK